MAMVFNILVTLGYSYKKVFLLQRIMTHRLRNCPKFFIKLVKVNRLLYHKIEIFYFLLLSSYALILVGQ